MAKSRIVKVCRPIIPPDGPWRAYDEKHEHEEEFDPNPWMREAMGGRMWCYFRATWSIDEGWIFTQRLHENYFFDEIVR